MHWLLSHIRRVWRRLTTNGAPQSPVTADGGTTDTGSRTPQADPLPETAVMSREQIVEYHLNQHGGRLKQGEIVTLTDWSAPKVSRVLSEMEADEEVIRITVGREKIVCLPDAAPAPADGTAASDSVRS